MKEYPNWGWFLVGINLGTVLTLLATMYLTKTDDKPKYKTKKEYAFVEPRDWASDSTMNDTKKEFLEYLDDKNK